MKNSQYIRQSQYKRGFVPVVLAVIVVLIVGGYLAYRYLARKQVSNSATETKSSVVSDVSTQSAPVQLNAVKPATPQSVDETANWKTYRNEQYGFEFKYPTGFNTDYANFSEEPTGIVSVHGNKDIDSNGCYVVNPDRPQDSKVVINNVQFCMSTGGNAGMSQLYRYYDYTIYKNEHYITLTYLVHTPNGCGVYKNSPDVNVLGNERYKACMDFEKNYDALVLQPIQKSVSTFTFTK